MFPLANEFGIERIVREMWDSAACLDCVGKCNRRFATRCKTKMISIDENGDTYIIYEPCKYSKVPRGVITDETLEFLKHQEEIRRYRIQRQP